MDVVFIKRSINFEPQQVRMNNYWLLAIVMLLSYEGISQGQAFGVKGGLSVAFQQWNSFSKDPLIAYHGDLFIESLPEDGKFSIFASAGYHVRGSATVFRAGEYYNYSTQQYVTRGRSSNKFQFNNLSLLLGGKQKTEMGNGDNKWYYLFGLRGEYTVNTNLDEYSNPDNIYLSLNYPNEVFLKRFNYGVTVGGGLEFMFSEYIGGLLEFTVSPDFSQQYYRPPVKGVQDPYRPGQYRDYGEEKIINTSMELSLGIRFLRKIEYVEDDGMW